MPTFFNRSNVFFQSSSFHFKSGRSQTQLLGSELLEVFLLFKIDFFVLELQPNQVPLAAIPKLAVAIVFINFLFLSFKLLY